MEKNLVEERKLVQRLLAGEERALRKFYKEYAGRLWRFIAVRVRCRQDAEEILQDTLLSALDSLALFSGRASLFSWLCSISRHEISDYYRKKRIRTILFSHFDWVEQMVGRALEPEAQLIRREFEAKVVKVLAGLAPHYRRILEFKYMDGMSVREIAGKLGMTFKACESALFRAKKAFEMEYSKEGDS